MIPFNKPFLVGKEIEYIRQAVESGKISGDGIFSKKCHEFFEKRYGFKKALLTTSCTDALEMAAILIDTKPDDEIIIPSFTFVSSANAFVLRGARLVFADSEDHTPNMDISKIESLITKKTKAILVVHYAGMACDMDAVTALAQRYQLFVIEDAAQAIDSYYKDRPLGSLGHLAAFSFHETKNVISGEGGMLVVNDERFNKRAEIIREKGTNRSAFFRGEVDKYGWVDIGSSFLPSDIIAAFLYAQLEHIVEIQDRRKQSWKHYFDRLKFLEDGNRLSLPQLPSYATNNAHMFFIICKSLTERTALIEYLRQNGIHAVFHYLSLHLSPFYHAQHDGRKLLNCERYSDCLLRLPMYYELEDSQVENITSVVSNFYRV